MRLLEPLTLGGHLSPNRILFGPHPTNLGTDRALSDRHTAYYARRARGGCGIVVTETASVHSSDWPYERAPLAEVCGPGWARIAAACHRGGALVVASLGHSGGQGSSAYSQQVMWAPSGVPEVNSREMPKVMETEDIEAVVSGFGRATAVAVASGVDGVEINAGQHSLVRQFLSGLTNQRADDYGTDRLRFAREVLAAVRRHLGSGILGLRLCADELAPWAGITPDDAVGLAAALAPLVDYLVVVRGSIYTVAATRPDGHEEPGFNLAVTARIRAGVDSGAAVFAQGSIVDSDMAEQALVDGTADGVEMTRAQIADPELVAKLAGDRTSEIRPCILCNQTCQVLDPRNPLVSCVVEPSSGYETTDPDLAGPAESGLRILVVGGGPSGLEAARVAAGRGHAVTLLEAGPVLGGRVRHAAAGRGRSRLQAIVGWLEDECRRLGVEMVLDHRLDDADLAAHDGPVILCTGGTVGEREYEVEPPGRVMSADGLLAAAADGIALPDGPIVVWDPIGGPIGVSVAELLAQRPGAGQTTTLVFPDPIPGTTLSRTGDLAPANQRLQSAGVRLVRHGVLRRVSGGGVEVEDRFGGGTIRLEAGILVDAGHRLPDPAWSDLPGAVRAGDAVAPRTIYEAILEGRRAVLAVEAGQRPAWQRPGPVSAGAAP